MENEAIITINDESIDINGMDGMVKFSNYSSFATDDFVEGLFLSEDLTNRFGTVLLSMGTELTPHHIERLLDLKVSNPSLELYFKISRNVELINRFRSEIKDQFMLLFDRQKRINVYSDFLDSIKDGIDGFVDTILSEDNMTLLLYQMRFLSGASKKSRSTYFMEHPLNVAMLSLAVASSKMYAPLVNKSRTKLLDVCKAAFLHSHGALTKLDTILDAPEESKTTMYWDACSEGMDKFETTDISDEVKEALSLLYSYQKGERDFIRGNTWPIFLSNILIVTEMYLRNENGLFGDDVHPRKIIDRMNVLAAGDELSEIPVKALTLGLNLMDIFDFYRELGRLTKKCPYHSAAAYPLTGFMSPTLFVCKKNVAKCRFVDGTMSAVTVVRKFGEFKPGEYRRCWLLTPKLVSFYKSHYRAIKSITVPHTGDVK